MIQKTRIRCVPEKNDEKQSVIGHLATQDYITCCKLVKTRGWIEQNAVSTDEKAQVKWEDVSNSAGDAGFQDICPYRRLESWLEHDKMCIRHALRHGVGLDPSLKLDKN